MNASERAEKTLKNVTDWKDKREHDLTGKPFNPTVRVKEMGKNLLRNLRHHEHNKELMSGHEAKKVLEDEI